MRAIIKCTVSVSLSQLQDILKDHHWSPTLTEGSNQLSSEKNALLETIHSDDRVLVESTYRFMIYDEITKSWGIVNEPNDHVVTFRLKNGVSDKLKQACEKLIEDLTITPPRIDTGGKEAVKFIKRIEVIAPNSDRTAFTGQIIGKRAWKVARNERKTEYYVGWILLVFSIILLFISAPPIFEALFGATTDRWNLWIAGNLERFATATLAALVISWATVALHWLDVRREGGVRWIVEAAA